MTFTSIRSTGRLCMCRYCNTANPWFPNGFNGCLQLKAAMSAKPGQPLAAPVQIPLATATLTPVRHSAGVQIVSRQAMLPLHSIKALTPCCRSYALYFSVLYPLSR